MKSNHLGMLLITAFSVILCLFIGLRILKRHAPFDPTDPAINLVQGASNSDKLWSILICTLDSREKLFNRLYAKLHKQITDLNLEDKIEILYFKDNREYSVGFKRNALIEKSRGKYICFIDDDDEISDDYIKIIHDRLLKNPDCISLRGIITFAGKNPKTFIHSIKYDTYFEKDNVYYRPPNHLNPMRRSVAHQFHFPMVNRGEDTNWAMKVCRSGLLQIEEQVDIPYYFYLFDGRKPHDA